MNKRKKEILPDIPQDEIESLARRLFPAILEYFESEEGQNDFLEWKKQKAEEAKSG